MVQYDFVRNFVGKGTILHLVKRKYLNLIIADLEGKNGSDFYTKFESCHRCLILECILTLILEMQERL